MAFPSDGCWPTAAQSALHWATLDSTCSSYFQPITILYCRHSSIFSICPHTNYNCWWWWQWSPCLSWPQDSRDSFVPPSTRGGCEWVCVKKVAHWVYVTNFSRGWRLFGVSTTADGYNGIQSYPSMKTTKKKKKPNNNYMNCKLSSYLIEKVLLLIKQFKLLSFCYFQS